MMEAWCLQEQVFDCVMLVVLCATNVWTLVLYLRARRRVLAAEMTGRFLQQCVNYCDREHGHLGQQEHESHA